MEQIWWERVPDACSYISDITKCLLDERSVVLQYFGSIPWKDFMTRAIRMTVRQQNSLKRFENLSNVKNPGAYLLQEYCKPEKRAMYRPTKGYARFLAESDDVVFHELYLWITIDSFENLEEWAKFISEYIKERGRGKATAVFILEWNGKQQINGKKGITTYCFDDYITEYDRIVFSMLASSSVKESPVIKKYLAELAAETTENDIELCAEILKDYSEFLQNPYHTLCCAAESERSDGSSFEFLKTEDEVVHCIWRAQIKTVYPLIEEYREGFVHKYEMAINAELPISSSCGEVYDNPFDVELGPLLYMAGSGRLSLKQKEHDRLKIFREARNKLSHLNVLSVDEICQLTNR